MTMINFLTPHNLGASRNVSTNRLKGLDALRGICALLVVAQHALTFRVDLSFIINSNDSDFYLDFGRIGVVAFFLISGYLIPFSLDKKSNGVGSFWCSRFFRLWPAYWISIVLALVTTNLVDRLNTREILVNFTMLQSFVGVPDAIGVFWTLAIELIFYFLLTLIFAFCTKDLERIFPLCFYGSIVLTIAMASVRFATEKKTPVAVGMALSLMFFAATFRSTRLRVEKFPFAELGIYLLSLPCICLLAYSGHVSSNDNAGRWIVAYFSGLLIFLVFERVTTTSKFLLWLGSISYSVYLLHSVVIDFLQNAFPKIDQLYLFLPTLVLIFLSASLCFFLVERPAQILGKRISKNLFPRTDVVNNGSIHRTKNL